jgi:hypothetical protein
VQVNVGKGGPWLLPFLCEQLALEPERCCIVGDRLDTDIALGKQGGMLTVLPLTGQAGTMVGLLRARAASKSMEEFFGVVATIYTHLDCLEMLSSAGVTTLEQAERCEPEQAPDFIVPSMVALAGLEC